MITKTLQNIIGQFDKNDTSSIVKSLLFALCFKNKLIGTQYLGEVLEIRCANSNETTSLSSGAYATVAQKHNSTVSGVEHAIRTAIRDCHQNGRLFLLNELFLGSIINAKYPPSNAELIAEICVKLNYYLSRTDDTMKCR